MVDSKSSLNLSKVREKSTIMRNQGWWKAWKKRDCKTLTDEDDQTSLMHVHVVEDVH